MNPMFQTMQFETYREKINNFINFTTLELR
jgi:hypothetical protein